MVAYKQRQPVTEVVEYDFYKVSYPQDRLLGRVNLKYRANQSSDTLSFSGLKLWFNTNQIDTLSSTDTLKINKENTVTTGLVDINVSRGVSKAGFKVYKMDMIDNALTICLMFKAVEQRGKLFGKEGINAFGKSYKTINCALDGNNIVVNPCKLVSRGLGNGVWQMLSISADEYQTVIYINDKEIGRAAGIKNLTTDALDFFTEMGASVKELWIYNKVLSKEEISQVFKISAKTLLKN